MQLFSSLDFDVMQNFRLPTSRPMQMLLWWFDFFFTSIFCIFFFFHYYCCCVLLALLLAIAIWVNKYFASSSGRKGWSACAGLRKEGIGRLLPLHLVWSSAIAGHVQQFVPYCVRWRESVHPNTFWGLDCRFPFVKLEVILQWLRRVVVHVLSHHTLWDVEVLLCWWAGV